MAKKFRDNYMGGSISLLQGVTFTLMMYSFAALLVAVVHYIYFKFIDNGFIINTYFALLDNMAENSESQLLPSIDQLKQAIGAIADLGPLKLTLQLISQNIFFGFLMAVPTGLLIMKRNKQ